MNNLKKIISAGLVLANLTPCVFAETNNEEVSANVWNYNIVEEGTENLYSDFPMIIDKYSKPEMGMDLVFTYLKNLTDNDSVTLEIKDVSDNSVVAEKTFTNKDCDLVFESVDNNKQYRVELNENIASKSNQYSGYIETSFMPADFPVNMTLGNYVIDEYKENSTSIMYKKIGDMPNCTHEDNSDCGSECSLLAYVHTVSPDELNTFYDTLDRNAYYEIQTNTTLGAKDSYKAYISTYDNGDMEGIFTRGFTFKKDLTPSYVPARVSVMASAESGDDYFSNIIDYALFKNEDLDFSQKAEYVFRFVASQTGMYAFETVGNANTMFEIYEETDGVLNKRPHTVRGGGEGENAYEDGYGWYIDEEYRPVVMYIVVSLEDYSGEKKSAFRVIKNDTQQSDDHTNYIDVIRKQCDNGNYSSYYNKNSAINYNRDVDLFGYEVRSGKGYMGIKSTYKNIYALIYFEGTNADGSLAMWEGDEVIADVSTGNIDEVNPKAIDGFSEGRCYVEVKQIKNRLPKYNVDPDNYYQPFYCEYTLDFYPPNRPDEYDAVRFNNSPYAATEISPNDYTIRETLHKGDSDMYTFTTRKDTVVQIELFKGECDYLHKLEFYDDDDLVRLSETSWRWNNKIDGVADSSNEKRTISAMELKANHKYYVYVGRANSQAYDSMKKYRLELTFSDIIYRPKLTENIQLNHMLGTTITSTDSYKEAILAKMTCTKNDTAIPASDISVSDLELYYDDSVLTPEVVNGLVAGTYTIVPKYKGKRFVTGTVTLTVATAAPEPTNIFEIDDIDNEPVVIEQMDWLAAAKVMVNIRLRREGYELNTTDLFDMLDALEWEDPESRGTAADTVRAAIYFYTNGESTTGRNFISASVSASTAETTLYNSIKNGKSVIMLLTSTTDTTDMSLARYLVLFGVDKDNHRFKVWDPINGGNAEWIDADVLLNGGYGGDSTLKFTGRIIEGTSK